MFGLIAVSLTPIGYVTTTIDRRGESSRIPMAASRYDSPKLLFVDKPGGHAFISYVREDSHEVDKLQGTLEAAGVSVWRDTADLWPGEDWRMKIRRAITDDALAFIACFSSRSIARRKSYQNEELLLAIEQLRLRRPDDIWLIPVRLDDCDIPDLDLGGGRTLGSIQRVDLFGDKRDIGIARLVTAVLGILGQPQHGNVGYGSAIPARGKALRDEFVQRFQADHRFDEWQDNSAAKSTGAATRLSTAGDPLPTASGHNSKVFEMDLAPGRYLLKWSVEGKGHLFRITDESERGGEGRNLVGAAVRSAESGEEIVRLVESGRHLLSVYGSNLTWEFTFAPI